jgi:hypothetical protein
MILNGHRQGVSVSVIANRFGIDRKTARKSHAWPGGAGLRSEPVAAPDAALRSSRTCASGAASPRLTGRCLWRELHDGGYQGGYPAVRERSGTCGRRQPRLRKALRDPLGDQAQVDFSQFRVAFVDQREVTGVVWLF